jgi:hypothetical protein
MSELARWVNGVLDTRPTAIPEKRVEVERAIPMEVDLIRVCANVNRYFASRYIFHEGIWKYGMPVVVDTNVLQNAYRQGRQHVVSWNDIVEERCPLCGAIGHVICCGRCKFVICRGRTTEDGFFRCREACGKSGWISNEPFTNRGIAL